jgi:hypothetical protein
MNGYDDGRPNGVGAPALASFSGGGVTFVQDPDVEALRTWIRVEGNAVWQINDAMFNNPPPDQLAYAKQWASAPNTGWPDAKSKFEAVDAKLGQLAQDAARANAQLTQLQTQLTNCQTQLNAALAAAKGGGGTVVPKSTQAPGVYVSAPAAAGVAVGSGLLGGVIGWWARGRGKRGGR